MVAYTASLQTCIAKAYSKTIFHSETIMFDKILKFEQALADFTGAPYVVMTDCCTHAIELCLRYDQVKTTTFTAYTYLSIPMTMHKLDIDYELLDEQWIGEYWFRNTRIWDSARRLEKDMYRNGTMQCVSFGRGKPLHIGRGGAILLDDVVAYDTMLAQRYDGRDLTISPWETQQVFKVGYHYKPTTEEAEQGLAMLEEVKINRPVPVQVDYPDCRKITIVP
jgi:dTDP-4-amino-4,6-dideoxygalactose transaminase